MYKSITGILFLFFTTIGLVFSQEFDVREFKADPTDLAAIRFPRRSVNDEPCALIKIVTNIQGMQFDSNLGIVDMVRQEDEGYWLYVPPKERRIRLMASGYLPLDLSLPEPAVESRVYNLVVTSIGVAGNIELIPVNFIVDGHDDTVLIIGEETYPIDQTLQLEKGIYDIRIEKPGYRPISTQIEVTETNTLFRYQLEGIMEETVTIRSNPPGATVYINNVKRNGETPFQEFLFPGSYTLKLSLSEYNDLETRIMVQENENNEFIFELQRFAGTLVLSVEPSDARVSINQRNYTGQKEIQLAPGTYRLLVEKDGYSPKEERFVIEQGGRIEQNIRLIPQTGALRFVSPNPDARFKLTSQRGETIRQWTGSTLMQDLHIGDYRYVGQLQGYADLKGSLSIRENQETIVDAVFSEELRQAYIREQEKITADAQKQQNILNAQKEREAREAEIRRTQLQDERKQNRKKWYAQDSYSTLNFSYTDLSLNTVNFSNNIEEAIGLGFGMTGVFGYWAMNMTGTYGLFTLNDGAQFRFDTEEVSVLSYAFTIGPAIRLFGFEFFGLAGLEGSIVSSDAFEYEELTVGDVIVEYGALFKPTNWSFGIRYCATITTGIIPSFPPFARQEFGVVFEF